MSRIGKLPVKVPAGVSVSIDGRTVTVSKGDASLSMEHRPEIAVAWDESEKQIRVSIAEGCEGTTNVNAFWGMTRSLLNNMVEGVTEGYQKQLQVVGVGYTAEVAGQTLSLKVGYTNTLNVPIPESLDVSADKSGLITVKGADKQEVGNFAASVRALRKPEPYNGKGIKYAGEVIRKKQGKAFGS